MYIRKFAVRVPEISPSGLSVFRNAKQMQTSHHSTGNLLQPVAVALNKNLHGGATMTSGVWSNEQLFMQPAALTPTPAFSHWEHGTEDRALLWLLRCLSAKANLCSSGVNLWLNITQVAGCQSEPEVTNRSGGKWRKQQRLRCGKSFFQVFVLCVQKAFTLLMHYQTATLEVRFVSTKKPFEISN